VALQSVKRRKSEGKSWSGRKRQDHKRGSRWVESGLIETDFAGMCQLPHHTAYPGKVKQ
jgi:hypothetical protein